MILALLYTTPFINLCLLRYLYIHSYSLICKPSRNDNGKPTINPENNLLAAPGSIQAMTHQKQRHLHTQISNPPQHPSGVVPIQSRQVDPTTLGGVKYLPGEVLVGQSPNPRLPLHENQQLQSTSSSVVHDHPSGARPSTSSTISSDHFSSDYFSSNTSHDCRHTDQMQHLPHNLHTKSGGCSLQETETAGHQHQLGEVCMTNINPNLISSQRSPLQNMQPALVGEKIHCVSDNNADYKHTTPQNCKHGTQIKCQQIAASKLCDRLSQNYNDREHSGENSDSEYTDDDEEYEEEGYVDEGSERRMITIQQTSQNQSILKHPQESGYYDNEENHIMHSSKQTSYNPRKISKTQRGCQTYYEDQATQTEDEEEDDEVCHKHGCRYRRSQDPTLEDATVLSGVGMK